MQILNNSNCMNTPIDYMYQNSYYGGAGYNMPAPQFYDPNQYGYQQPQQNMYNPFMQQPLYNGYNQQVNQTTQTFDDTIPAGLAQTPSMQKQFEYQNDYRYQYYGNNNSQSYYPNYGSYYGYNGYGNGYNPYAYNDPGYYNPYMSNTMMYNMITDPQRQTETKRMFDINGNEIVNPYFSVAQQQKIMQEQYEQQRQTYEMLCNLNNRWFGIDPQVAEDTKLKAQQEQEKQYRKFVDYQNEVNLFGYINYIAANAPDPQTYESPARRRYIEAWNKKYDEWQSKFPENYTMYEFFNESIAENMYMECKIQNAKWMDTELSQLYDRTAFRNKLAMQHPGYNPKSGISTYSLGNGMPRAPLTIDDMEIRLPDYIKNTEEFKRKEKFINSIIGQMNL